uniref:Uncharacterized protein n=1 Tax=viral metagenome TaxID=1070528 RepID=A0A6C0LQY1_9ZZZZ
MSINFYSNSNENSKLTSLTLQKLMNYSEIHGFRHKHIGNVYLIITTWKKLNDIYRYNLPHDRKNVLPKFMKIIDQPGRKITINIATQNKFYEFTSGSGMNLITEEAIQAPDQAQIVVKVEDIIENFENFEFKVTKKYLIIIVMIMVILLFL